MKEPDASKPPIPTLRKEEFHAEKVLHKPPLVLRRSREKDACPFAPESSGFQTPCDAARPPVRQYFSRPWRHDTP